MSDAPRSRWPFVLAMAGVAAWVTSIVLIGRMYAQSPPGAGFDLELLLTGGRRVAAGLSPYEPAMLAGQSVGITTLFYSYPPLVAQAFAPVCWRPVGADVRDAAHRRAARGRGRLVVHRPAVVGPAHRAPGVPDRARHAAVLVPVHARDDVREPRPAVRRLLRARAAGRAAGRAVTRFDDRGRGGHRRRDADQAAPRRARRLAAGARRARVAAGRCAGLARWPGHCRGAGRSPPSPRPWVSPPSR